MWDPAKPWNQQGSYVQPVTPPAAHPSAAPRVCVSFNQDWLPYVLGSLLQLCQPSSWEVADETARSAALLDAQELLFQIAAAEGCMSIRWNDATCALEVSTDGGATWAAVSGWDIAGLAACLEVHLPAQPIVRWNDGTCALEVSLDGGATYGPIPGWDRAGVEACILAGLTIRIDAGG